MLADLVSVDRFGVDIEVASDAGAEAGSVKDGAGADNALSRETGELHGVVSEDVHGV